MKNKQRRKSRDGKYTCGYTGFNQKNVYIYDQGEWSTEIGVGSMRRSEPSSAGYIKKA